MITSTSAGLNVTIDSVAYHNLTSADSVTTFVNATLSYDSYNFWLHAELWHSNNTTAEVVALNAGLTNHPVGQLIACAACSVGGGGGGGNHNGDPPSGISADCWATLLDFGINVAGLIAAAVSCATTGVGCILFAILINLLPIPEAIEIKSACNL